MWMHCVSRVYNGMGFAKQKIIVNNFLERSCGTKYIPAAIITTTPDTLARVMCVAAMQRRELIRYAYK